MNLWQRIKAWWQKTDDDQADPPICDRRKCTKPGRFRPLLYLHDDKGGVYKHELQITVCSEHTSEMDKDPDIERWFLSDPMWEHLEEQCALVGVTPNRSKTIFAWRRLIN